MNLLPFFFLFNSFVTIGLILNQNDVGKDPNQTASSNVSPWENGTWIGLLFQFFFLLVQTKMADF